ncbi:stringent starvation protein A [Ectothiorhodospiraceae bacterium BW-2]|nr:stringent starvation protein A [Ectothiorhodospiraceae bacterium BW-2]
MGVIANRHSMITLFSDDSDIYSHRVRLVMAEKVVTAEYISVAADEENEDLIQLNPYNNTPTLVDRELVLYGSQVIMEYLEERYPHPPLMPVDPVSRASNRLMFYRVEQDLYRHYQTITTGSERQATVARREIRDNLTAVSPIFDQMPFFMSEEFSLVDCSLVPLLWRLPVLGVNLPKQTTALQSYARRMFERDSFIASLTTAEKEMQPE